MKKKKLKKKIIHFFRKLMFLIILVIVTIISYEHYQPENIIEKEVTVVVEKDVGVSLEKKIEELKETLLDDLKDAEVRGYEDRDLIIVFDPMRKDLERCSSVGGVKLHCYSFGVYQFKIGTVQHYYEKFYGYTPGDKEAMDVALDPALSRELAEKVIFDEVGGVWNWKNSAEKIGAKGRIEIIRQLEA